MIIYLTGIQTHEPLYINQNVLFNLSDISKAIDVDGTEIIEAIKPTNKEITNDLLKYLLSKNIISKIVAFNKKPTYTLVKIEVNIEKIDEQELDSLIVKYNQQLETKSKNPITRVIYNTQNYFSSFLKEDNQYIIDFKEQKGCSSGVFNDFDDITIEQFKKINKLPCLFDSRMLLPELNSEEYADGCVHFCAKSILDQHPGIKNKVIERFFKYLNRGIYNQLINGKSGDISLPKLISDKELEYISNFQSQNVESLEKRFKLKDSASKQTILNKRKNTIIFNGNNLNPLPMELFTLWQTILNNYKYFINRFQINESIISQWDIIPLYNLDSSNIHYEDISQREKTCLFPYNSSLVISLYKDEELSQDLFYISLQCPPIDLVSFNNRNQITLPADEYLKNLYYYWKNYKERNPKKYNKEYKQPQAKSNISQDFICENCLISDTCNKKNCYLSRDDFEFLINKNNKFNIHVHKTGSPMLSINEWKQIIDNLASTIDIYQFNICGDEPLLFSDLIELTEYIKSLGIACSLETSGLFLTDNWMKNNLQYYNEITISVDSFDDDACAILGKINKDEKYLSADDISSLVLSINRINPECKVSIETKVMQINKHEKMLDNVKNLDILPQQWRLVKYEVTDNDFMYFINKNFIDEHNVYDSVPGLKIIIEDETNNYSFIDNNGVLCKKVNKRKKEILDIATETFVEDIKKQKIKIFDE